MLYKTYFIVLLFSLFFTSCEIKLEPDTRVLVAGRVLDSDGNAIENAEISVYTRRSPFSYSEEYLLGRNYSTSEGYFEVISLYEKYRDFAIEITAGDYFSKYAYFTDTENYTPQDLTFNLNTKVLSKLSSFNYSINRVSPPGTTLQYTFTFVSDQCIEFYINGALNVEQSFCHQYNSTGATLSNERPDISSTITTLQGSEVLFSYSINNQPEILETLIIDQENYEFNFNY